MRGGTISSARPDNRSMGFEMLPMIDNVSHLLVIAFTMCLLKAGERCSTRSSMDVNVFSTIMPRIWGASAVSEYLSACVATQKASLYTLRGLGPMHGRRN